MMMTNKKFMVLLLLAFSMLWGAYLKDVPTNLTEPDGTIINCYASGDEYYSWLHDQEGYTIVQKADGYYYYGVRKNDLVVASPYRVDSPDPAELGLKKWQKIAKQTYLARRESRDKHIDKSSKAPHTGTLNNIAIYIKFGDDSEFNEARSTFDDRFNPEDGQSMKSYFREVSYNNLTINTTHYPACNLNTNISYTDSHPRGYYQPYNAYSNPQGYSNEDQSTSREHTLLVNAINYVADAVPADLDIDGDNDGRVDNVCFIVRGNNDGWSDLLWAHRWTLFSQVVYIRGKRVYDYTFQPEPQNNTKTLCHEMFHALGAPDLYHYYDNTNLSPAGPWDLMESGFGHMGAYMKWKYADQKWISDIPEITSGGVYNLNPLSSSTNNCFKISSPNSSSEFFVVEYRKQGGEYESSVPGSGLLVYRINPAYDGNANNGGEDEVYIYRPNGTTSNDGSIYSAHFSASVGRTSIDDTTNPSSFLTSGSDGGLEISQIGSAGETISFRVSFAGETDEDGPVIDPAAEDTFYSGSPAIISATVSDNSAITYVKLAYSLNGGAAVETVMSANGSVYTAAIPAQAAGSSASWYIKASDEYNNVTTSSASTVNWINFSGMLDGFETYTDFNLSFGDWSQIDSDGLPTYTIDENNFTNDNYTGSYIIFNPSQLTNTADAALMPHSGDKFAACFSAVPGEEITHNDDWLVAAAGTIGTTTEFSFWAKSFTDEYGLERFRVGAATSNPEDPASFTIISDNLNTPGKDYIEAPLSWTKYSFDLSSYKGKQSVYVAVQCISADAYIFMLDDFQLLEPTSSDISQTSLPVLATLSQNYPNPFNPETTITFDIAKAGNVKISVYNFKGELVSTLVNERMKTGNHRVNFDGKALATGIYFYKMETEGFNKTMKMTLIK